MSSENAECSTCDGKGSYMSTDGGPVRSCAMCNGLGYKQPPLEERQRQRIAELEAELKRVKKNAGDVCQRWIKNAQEAVDRQRKAEIELEHVRKERDCGYSERNRLVAFVTRCFPAHVALHPSGDEEWDPEWRTIVFVNSPAGQLSWHVHCSEISMFSHLPQCSNDWDGHTVEEKYERLDRCSVPYNELVQTEQDRDEALRKLEFTRARLRGMISLARRAYLCLEPVTNPDSHRLNRQADFHEEFGRAIKDYEDE